MKIAYLILAHRNQKHVKKMIDILSCEDCAFFIHIDAKSNINDFSLIQSNNVYFIDKRVSVFWGEYSMVQAILILIQQALDAPQNYQYCVLLSGSDYPIRSKEYIHNFFDKNRGTEFISIIKMPNKGKPISRLNTLRIPSDKPIYRFMMRILAKLGLAQRDHRKHLGALVPYAGSTWWALTRDACQYILDFVNKKNQSICKYYERTFASDEMFFHTILGNSVFKSRILRNLMFDDWSNQGAHPELISEKHITFFDKNEKIVFNDMYGSGEMLFARKFSDDNLNIVQRIDNMIKRKEKNIR